MTPYERDILIRTILGEAANEGPQGWGAVAHVIRNRMEDPRWPADAAGVALQPKQFSAWNTPGQGGNDLVRKYGPDSPLYQKVGDVVGQVWAGDTPDPTGGATHYYAPAGMPGGRQPKWFPSITQERGEAPKRIGGHVFTGKVSGRLRRPHSQTPGMEVPQYAPDSPYYRAPGPEQAQVVPVPKPKPPGFDWRSAMSGAGSLLSALGGGQQNEQQAAERQAFIEQAQRDLDEAAMRRRAWNRSFTWL